MKKNAFRVSIPEPCHENWNAMTPKDKGRFCAVCTKTVVDFSVMGDAEVFDILKKGSANMCGHFHTEQLDRIIAQPAKPRWFLQPFWKYFVGVFLFFKLPSAKAQGRVSCTPLVQNDSTPKLRGQLAVSEKPQPQKIYGTVVSALDKSPLAGAIVTLKGTKTVTRADAAGKFEMSVQPGDILQITYIGFSTTEYQVGKTESNITVSLFELKEAVTTGVVVVTVRRPDEPNEWPKHALFVVKDAETGAPVKNAAINWYESKNDDERNVTTGGKGKINTPIRHEGAQLDVTVSADGYETTDSSFQLKNYEDEGRPVLTIRMKKEEVTVAEYAKPIDKAITGSIQTVTGDQLQDKKKMCTNDAAKMANTGLSKALQGTAGWVSVEPVNKKDVVKTTPVAQPEGAEKKTAVKAVTAGNIALSVYPNPADRKGNVNLVFTSKTAGIYMAQLVDAEGKIILNHRFEAIKGQNPVNISLPAGLNTGILTIKLMNSAGKWIASEQVVIGK